MVSQALEIHRGLVQKAGTLRRLSRREVVGFPTRGETVITCLCGEIWVTGPGLDDQVLSPGQSARAVEPGRVVVQGLTPSGFYVTRPR